MSGTVLEVNAEPAGRAGIVNDDPYGDGWLIAVAILAGVPDSLLDAANYRQLVDPDGAGSA